MSSTSLLRPIISEALFQYRPIRDQEVNKKASRAKRIEYIDVPNKKIFFSDLYEELKVNKSALKPFWIKKDYTGRKNEEEFIKFLESKNNKKIEWWYKNEDVGSEYFSISYYNLDEKKEKLFYPDWIIKGKKNIYIIDTKAGITAENKDTKYKSEALQKWLKNKKNFQGGIVVKDGPNGWKINYNSEYSFDSSLQNWQILEII